MINQTIGEFDCFVELYSFYMIRKHHDNPHWRTKEQVIELSGGEEELYELINVMELEVCSGIITTDEAAQLLTYGNVVE